MSFLFRRKIGTSLTVKPRIFEIESEKDIKINALLSPLRAPAELIEWKLEGVGALSTNKGPTTTYKAPRVDKKTDIKILVEFPGHKNFLPTSSVIKGVVLPPGMKAKTPTSLTVTPPNFSITSEEKITLSASLIDLVWDEELKDKKVKWIIEPPTLGYLSSYEGMSVVYCSPKVSREEKVAIKAIFEGDETHMSSESRSLGIIYPVTFYDEYIVSLSKGDIETLRIEGPIEVDGIKALKILMGPSVLRNLTVSRINFSAENATIDSGEIIATCFIATDLGTGKEIKFDTTKEVTYDQTEVSLENVSIFALKVVCKNGSFDKLGVSGRYIGGEEPYLPINFVAKDIEMKKGYSVTGPENFGELVNKVTRVRAGFAEAKSFMIKLPLDYKLDREKNKREFREKWIAELKNAKAENLELTTIYAKVIALRIFRVTFTGEEWTPSVIPHGFHKGEQAPINDADVDAVAVYSDKMNAEEVTIYIKK
ncbi:MAG: hypothetical protein QXO15_04480 [Nitrososphaerota archaeon]